MATKEEKLLVELERARDAVDERFHSAPPGMDFKEFDEYMREVNRACSAISKRYRLIKTPTYSEDELPDYGDVMSIEEFVANCDCGGLNNC